MQQTNHSDTPKPSEASLSHDSPFTVVCLTDRGDADGFPVALVLEFAPDPVNRAGSSEDLYWSNPLDFFVSVLPSEHLTAHEGPPLRLTSAQLIRTACTPAALVQESRYWSAEGGPFLSSLFAPAYDSRLWDRGPFESWLIREAPRFLPILRLEPHGFNRAGIAQRGDLAGDLLKTAARWQWLALCTGEADKGRQEDALPKIIGPYCFRGDIGSAPNCEPKSKESRETLWEVFSIFEAAEHYEREASASGLRGADVLGWEERGFIRDLEGIVSEYHKVKTKRGAEDA